MHRALRPPAAALCSHPVPEKDVMVSLERKVQLLMHLPNSRGLHTQGNLHLLLIKRTCHGGEGGGGVEGSLSRDPSVVGVVVALSLLHGHGDPAHDGDLVLDVSLISWTHLTRC